MFPPESVQHISGIEPWWEKDDEPTLCRGRLVWAFLPHVDIIPYTLEPVDREEPTQHRSAHVRIKPLDAKHERPPTLLPIAALPPVPKEVYTVYRAKRRPCLVLQTGGLPVEDKVRGSKKATWTSRPAMTVAPYYGVDAQEGGRSGWENSFVQRIQYAMYPQYFLEQLPLAGSTPRSVLRLDHLQPVGPHHQSLKLTEWRLSQAALAILDDWVSWLWDHDPEDADLAEIKDLLNELAPWTQN